MPRRGLCPSAGAGPGSALFGVVARDGTIAYLPKALRVTPEFLDTARQGREPERRFRFASPCQAAGCGNWRDGGCSLPRRVAEDLAAAGRTPPEPTAAPCAIRPACVWFAEAGLAACAGCRFVVTDLDREPQTRGDP